ncbi:MAG TPA: hypothetical protein VLB29_04980 [Nocardioidaceae bacterium]|nr:hypothetical protein [Nocardioidaceae bacterium]
MADADVELHVLQRVAGHQDPVVTSRYLHPDLLSVLDAGAAFSAWWSPLVPSGPSWPSSGEGKKDMKRGLTCKNRSGPRKVD